MNVKKIAIAVSMVFGSSLAMAADLTTGVTASNIIYVAGASAQTANISKAIAKACTTQADVYVDDVDEKSAFVYVCNSAVTTTTANKIVSGLTGKFIVVKYEIGGSFDGVGPLVNNVAIKFPDLTTATSNTAAGASTSVYTDNLIKGRVTLSTSTNNQVPDIALSDVEVDIWRARGNTYNNVALGTSGYSASNVYALQGFGLAASPLLYAALQTDQGINSSTCATSPSLASSCQPSITKAQYASLVSSQNQIAVWKKLLPNTAVGSYPTSLTIAARADTSGTQAASDIYFLGNPCQNGSSAAALNAAGALVVTDAAVDNEIASYPTTTVTVQRHSTSGDVRTALASTTGYVLGVLSLENAEPSTANTWRYVKVDGMSPNYSNGVLDSTQKVTTKNGQYHFAYNMSLLKRTGLSSGASTFANYIVSTQGDGAQVGTSRGLLADPASTVTPNATGTTKYSRGGLSCSAMQLTSFH